MLAACQTGAIIAALYADRRDLVEQLVGDEGQVLLWQHRPESWPPSLAVIRSGSGRYFVLMPGTVNISQWRGHVIGSFLRSYAGGQSLLNGQWAYAADEVGAEIQSVIPPPSEGVVHYSGHSYGGAVAQVLAFRRLAAGDSAAQVLTFGAPKAYTSGYPGPLPSVYWRVASTNDVVSTIPPDIAIGSFSQWAYPMDIIAQNARWTHYGAQNVLNWNGEYNANTSPPVDLPVGVQVGIVSEHSMRNYWGRYNQRQQSIEPTPGADVALSYWLAALSGEGAQPLTPELPRTVRGPDGSGLVDVPFYGGVPPAYFGIGGATMANPTPLTSGNPMKITLMLNADRQGWTESFYLWTPQSLDKYDCANRYAQDLIAARKTILSNRHAIEAVRVSDDSVRNDSSLTCRPNWSMGAGAASGEPACVEQGYQTYRTDQTRFVRESRSFRGLPVAMVATNPTGGPFPVDIPSQVYTEWFNPLKKLLTSEFIVQNRSLGIPCLKTYQRDSKAENLLTQVDNFRVGDDGYLQVDMVQGTTTTLFSGNTVFLSHTKRECVRGLSGLTTILKKDTPLGSATTFTLGNRPKCVSDAWALLRGTLYARQTIYVAAYETTLGRVITRDVGRAFFATAGARRRR